MKELHKKIKKFNAFIDKTHSDKTPTERKLLKAAKLPEEVGEFYAEFLKTLDFTRAGRTGDFELVKKELADVVLTSLVIAEELEIDIWKELEAKMKIIESRFGL